MFKLESYIAPILLSYVDKYIKNFRLEDSQVRQ
jgi:vacuolar protein sorting-associated protein 13B